MKTYNKLIRDKIPDIIAATGRSAKVRLLSEEEYEVELQKKFTKS